MKRDYDIDLFRPGDAAGVARLFTEVYGDGYPVKVVYNPEQLVAGFERREYIPVVARTPDGRILGYTSLYRSAPYEGLYEVGHTLVLPDYRKTPVAGLIIRHTLRTAPKIPGVGALFCEAVCNHTHIQRAGVMFKCVETAIEIDLMPSEAYEKEQSASGRVATIDIFKTILHKPHTVYIPGVYEDYCRYVYGGLDDSRTIHVSADGFPSGGSTEITTLFFDFAQLARVTVSEAGTDFGAIFDAEEKRIADRHCTIVQVWFKSSWPWIGAVVDILRARGFFLGGILPGWFGEDGFFMQKVLGRPNWEGINLYTDRAKEILRFTRDDQERT